MSMLLRLCASTAFLTLATTACGGGDDGDTTPSTGTSGTSGTSSTSGNTETTSTGEPETTATPTTQPGSTSTDTSEDPTTGASTTTGTTDPTDGPATSSTTTSESTGTTGPAMPMGSAGCGLTPEAGSLEMEVQGQMGQYIVSLPAGYDPTKPYPLGFGFHGRNRTGPNCHDGDCAGFQSVMEDEAILVYMTSLGGTGWEGDGEREINVEFFEKVLDDVVASGCVDESRVFVAGTSSGAHFVNVLGCRFGDRLLAIAPVAGYLPETECVGEVAALVIHGFKDPHVPLKEGEKARDFWRARNGCSETTTPAISEVHAAAEATPESHSCAVYDGCQPGLPVVWCEHSEGGYDDSTHGWPLFGGQQIWDFVQSL